MWNLGCISGKVWDPKKPVKELFHGRNLYSISVYLLRKPNILEPEGDICGHLIISEILKTFENKFHHHSGNFGSGFLRGIKAKGDGGCFEIKCHSIRP